jgi:hypothetical protein
MTRRKLPEGGESLTPAGPNAQGSSASSDPTSRILPILQHALGRNQYGKNPNGRPDYRNHFCAGGDDLAPCREAASLGLMVEHAPCEISGGDPIFVVTDAGKAYVLANSPPPPKVSRGQRRYLRWLEVADVVGGSFGEWLKREARGAR